TALTDLRIQLKTVNGRMSVVKNRVFKKALDGKDFSSYEALSQYFKGPVAVIFLNQDIGAGAKIISKFAEDHESFSVQAGFYEETLLSDEDIQAIAKLPSKEELYAKILSSLMNPHRNLLGVLQAVPRNLVGVLSAVSKQLEQK
ncbi:MAG: 50S ribosomal protein L10, partial [Proteobacteria bacterium]|nr:50S ribosomal protein L10 [Pseudomonadota bacterium]